MNPDYIMVPPQAALYLLGSSFAYTQMKLNYMRSGSAEHCLPTGAKLKLVASYRSEEDITKNRFPRHWVIQGYAWDRSDTKPYYKYATNKENFEEAS